MLDLESHLVDVAVKWGKAGIIDGFQLSGRTQGSVQAWSDGVLRQGRQLQEAHFEGRGVELDLGDCAFLGTGFAELEVLVAAIKKDIAVTTLRLPRCQLDDMGANMLAGALMRNRTLREVVLTENCISDEGAEALAAALDQNPALQRLDLSDNLLGAAGAGHVAEALRRSRGLCTLDLSGNPLGDAGAERLAAAADPNAGLPCPLYWLGLADCGVGRTGAEALGRLLRARGSVLEELELGEHGTLRRQNARDRQEPGQRFFVHCGRAGVQVSAEPLPRLPRMAWEQDGRDLEVSFNDGGLKRTDRPAVRVQLDVRRLLVQLGGAPSGGQRALADLELFGPVLPDSCRWRLTDGRLRVLFTKAEPVAWPQLEAAAAPKPAASRAALGARAAGAPRGGVGI